MEVKLKPPEWDLGNIYIGISDPKIGSDLKVISFKTQKFMNSYKGNVSKLDNDQFYAALKEYEAINALSIKVRSFCDLMRLKKTSDHTLLSFWQNTSEELNRMSSLLTFFQLEVSLIDDKQYFQYLTSLPLKSYKKWFDKLRIARDFFLKEEIEIILRKKNLVGTEFYGRLFDEALANIRFDLDGEVLTLSKILGKLGSNNKRIRKTASKVFAKGLENNIQLTSQLLNVIIKDKQIEDELRGFSHPASARNLENEINDDVVESMISTISENYEATSHRYYAYKAKRMGLNFLNYWDRNAPLPESTTSYITWEAAKKIIVEAYQSFDTEFGKIASQLFVSNRIDAAPRTAKYNGAMCSPSIAGPQPYILLNYKGGVEDVLTCAHEIGHGIHRVLAWDRGFLMSQPSTILAETASCFGESLVFQSLLYSLEPGIQRHNMLANRVENLLNNICRQTAFHQFETKIHSEGRESPLNVERIGQLWMETQQASLGPSFRLDSEYSNYWSYIPHFFHSPFYAYSYAHSSCVVNSLFKVFGQDKERFRKKYKNFLMAGGAITYSEFINMFDLDAFKPTLWKKGLETINDCITELEEYL